MSLALANDLKHSFVVCAKKLTQNDVSNQLNIHYLQNHQITAIIENLGGLDTIIQRCFND